MTTTISYDNHDGKTGRPTLDYLDRIRRPAGYRSSVSAADSVSQCKIQPTTVDYWQDKQLAWQEDCDVVMVQFDRDVADHFPVHQPMDMKTGQVCPTCPQRPILPLKPHPPVERALTQLPS